MAVKITEKPAGVPVVTKGDWHVGDENEFDKHTAAPASGGWVPTPQPIVPKESKKDQLVPDMQQATIKGKTEVSVTGIPPLSPLAQEFKNLEKGDTVMFASPIEASKLMNLSVGAKRKLNLENYGGAKYESAEVFISLTVPCQHSTLADAYEFAQDWVDNKMVATIKAATGGK